MSRSVKPTSRPYNAERRRAAAGRTRRAILDAAARLFAESGYAATTMADIAAHAGVATDTIYAVVGTKAVLFRELIEAAVSGADEPITLDQREYVSAIHAEPYAGRKIDLYAGAVATIQGRLAPLLQVLREAAPGSPELAAVWREITERRARNMRLFVAELASTGALREGLSLEEAADAVWAMNSSEIYGLLVHERGWTPEHYERWLADAWKRLFLRSP